MNIPKETNEDFNKAWMEFLNKTGIEEMTRQEKITAMYFFSEGYACAMNKIKKQFTISDNRE